MAFANQTSHKTVRGLEIKFRQTKNVLGTKRPNRVRAYTVYTVPMVRWFVFDSRMMVILIGLLTHPSKG